MVRETTLGRQVVVWTSWAVSPQRSKSNSCRATTILPLLARNRLRFQVQCLFVLSTIHVASDEGSESECESERVC